MITTIIELLLYFIDNMSLLLIAFAIYRLPIKYNVMRLMCAGVVMTGVNFLQRDMFQNTQWYILINLLVGVILVVSLFRLPIAYSLLVVATGAIILVAVQMLNIVVPLFTGLATIEELQSKYMIIPSALVISIIIFIIQKKKLGFMLIANRFSIAKGAIKARDLFVAGIFICFVVLAQTALSAFNNRTSLILFLIGMIVLLFIGLGITYWINIKEIEERYFNLKRKKK